MWRYLIELKEEELLKAYETFPEGFEIVEKKPNGYLIAIYSEHGDKKFPFHLVRKEEVKYKDWKEYYKPILIGKDVVIVPPWEVAKPEWENKTVLVINPGKAFGTGLHESTQLSLQLLSELDLKGKKILDVGCGSGILSIYCAKKGASEVVAVDIDPLAVEETVENAKVNKVSEKIKAFQGSAKNVNGTFPIVVANLEIHIFREVLKDIAPKVEKFGVFSGIYKPKELAEFITLLDREGLKPIKVIEKNNWYGILTTPIGEEK
jgi:ribosomal protein L11 methyltransferase